MRDLNALTQLASFAAFPAPEAGVLVQYSADFAAGAYTIQDEVVDQTAALTYGARAGVVWLHDFADDWFEFAANAAPLTDRGLLVDGAGQNHVRTTEPTAPGTTLPTNWSEFLSAAGISRTFTGTVTIDGVLCQKVRVFGTAGNNNGYNLRFETSTQIVAANGEMWTPQVLLCLTNGKNVTGVEFVRLNIEERTAAGAIVATRFGTNFKSVLTSDDVERFGHGGKDTLTAFTLAGGGTVERVTPCLNITWLNGQTFDIELAIGLPVMEKAAVSASYPFEGIRGTTAATLHLPADNGPFDLTLTFDNASQQVIPDVPGGDYAIDPAILSGPKVVASAVWGAV
jgi:hypothetical protein